jgi:hypothetical protein
MSNIVSPYIQGLLDAFNPPEPKWVYEPPPEYAISDEYSIEKQEYWDEQYRRWKYGHAGLTGAHYFYIQECMLKDIYGNSIHPIYRDVDDMIFQWVQECIELGEALLIYKRRDIGATSVFCNIAFWFMRMFPGSLVGLTSKDQSGIFNMFNDKVLFNYRRMNKPVINTEPVQMNNTKQLCSLQIAFKKKDAQSGRTLDEVSEIYLRETSEKPDSVNNISGRRLIYCYIDESALHKRIDGLLGSIFPVLMQGPKRTGFLAMAGTVEPSLTHEEVAKFYALIQRSKNLKIRTEILPVWMGLFMKNGYSCKEAGLAWWDEQMKPFLESGDTKGARDFRMQYPRGEDDLFDLSQGSLFEPDVADIIMEAHKKADPSLEKRFKLVDMGGEVRDIPNNNGDFYMIEPPREGIMYYQCIDGVASGTLYGDAEGSNVASITFKGYDPLGNSYEPVCIYYKRPERVEDSYIAMANQFTFYNKYGCHKGYFYEANAGTSDHFGTFLSKIGHLKHAGRRRDLSGKGFSDTKKYGQAVTKEVKEWQIKQANIFLRKEGHSIRMKMLLQDLLKTAEENADMRDAFFMFMVAIPNFGKPVKQKQENRFRTIYELKNVNGKNVHVPKKIPLATRKEDDASEDYELYTKQFTEKMVIKYGEKMWYQKMVAEEKDIYKDLLSKIRKNANF